MSQFKKLEKNVKIFDNAKIIKPEIIEILKFSEIDDFNAYMEERK